MSNWKKYKLGEIAEIVGGGTPSTKESENFGDDIAWITPRDLSNYTNRYISKGERSITNAGLKNSSAKVVPAGTVLLTTRAPVGYLAIASNEVATNQGFRSLITNPEIAHNEFLYYLLKNNVELLKSNSTGTTFGELSGSTLKSLEFDFPTLPIQYRIASILSSLDDKIELNRKMNKTLEQMAQALFKKWFDDDETEKVPMTKYIEINPSLSISKNSVVKYVEMADLPSSGMSIVSYIQREFTSGSKFQNYDTLLARITPCLENGKTAFVDFLNNGEIAYGSTEFIVMRAKGSISKYYPYLLARDENFRNHAISSMSGTSGRQRVQTDMLAQYELNIIDEKKMKLFHTAVEPMFNTIRKNTIESLALSKLRDTLLPKLMSGEVDVKDITN